MQKIIVSAGRSLLFFAVWGVQMSLATLAIVRFGGEHFFQNIAWSIALESCGAVAALIALLILARFLDRRGLSTLGFARRLALPGLATGVFAGALIFCLPVGILLAHGDARWAPDFTHFSATALSAALLLVFVNVIDQELLVRSYVFQELWSKYSGAAAVTVSTLLFVALHAAPILHGSAGALAGANVALASIMLGLDYLRSGALWLPIGLHFGWNAVQGAVLGIPVTGHDLGVRWHLLHVSGSPLWTGGSMGVEGGLAGLAGPALGILLVLLLFRDRKSAGWR
jgi:membrane protease YdiL (CAAX protease family)